MDKALYVRVDEELHAHLRQVANTAALPMATVVEAMIATEIGHEHPHRHTLARAITAWKRRPK